MLKRNKNRKGFTLAELLIVVAIIAVLVAIAVPLFVGALDNAEERVFESNARSLKGMAVSAMLSSKDFNISKVGDDGVKVKGTVDQKGNVALTDWNVSDAETTWGTYKTQDWSGTTEGEKTKTIIVTVTKANIKEYVAPTAVPGG